MEIYKQIKNAMDREFARANVSGVEGIKKLTAFKDSLPESENFEATGSASAGGFETPLFSSPNKKETKEGEKLKGGKADNLSLIDIAKKHKVSIEVLKKQLKKGINIEKEHTKNEKIAIEIAIDHLYEDPKYYDKLDKIEESWSEKYKKSIDCNNPKGFSQKAHCQGKKKKTETKEATGSSSSGSYETPKAWAKTMSKKDWRGKSKTQIPGGKFVQVKEKCKKFPYCNQGDIKALKIFENDLVKNAIKNISEKHGISKKIILKILQEQFKKINNTNQ